MRSEDKYRVLLIDASAIFGHKLISCLTNVPSVIYLGQAREVMDAIEKINSNLPDIVLLDMNLPNFNSFTILYWLRDSYKDIKVIMLSNHSQPDYQTLALQQGADYFIDKSLLNAKLLKVLNEISKTDKDRLHTL